MVKSTVISRLLAASGVAMLISGCAGFIEQDSNPLFLDELDTSRCGVVSIAYSPDGKYLATAHHSTWPLNRRVSGIWRADTIRLWEVDSSYPFELAALTMDVFGDTIVQFTPDSRFLVATNKGKLQFWDIAKQSLEKRDIEHVGPISQDCQLAAAWKCEPAGSVRLLDVHTGEVRATLPEQVGTPLAFSPDGRLLATMQRHSGTDGVAIAIWDLSTAALQAQFHAEIWAIAFSLDGRFIAMPTEDDATLGIWETASGIRVATLGEHAGPIRCVAFSPDGSMLACGAEGAQIKFWDVRSGKEVDSILDRKSSWGITAVTFSPDGQILASGDGSGNVKFWKVPAVLNSKSHER